jgi:hypothetical protein
MLPKLNTTAPPKTNLRHHITSPHLTSSLPPSISESNPQSPTLEPATASPYARPLDSRTPSPVEPTPPHRLSARPPTSTQPERRRTPKHAKPERNNCRLLQCAYTHTRQMRKGRVATGYPRLQEMARASVDSVEWSGVGGWRAVGSGQWTAM